MEPRPKLSPADLQQVLHKMSPTVRQHLVLPDKNKVEQLLVQQALQQEHQWLTDMLAFSLAAAGFETDEASLQLLMPRLCYRTYADGTVVVAIDAQPKTAEHPATLGRQLFGFGPTEFERLSFEPARWGYTRRVLDAERAALYELRQRYGAEPYPYIRPDVHEPRLSDYLSRFATVPNAYAAGSVNAADEG